MSQDLPSSAQVVIVGGGVIGCAIAYHLVRAGVSEVVLLERKELTCGTTWHAAGLVGQLRGSYNMTRLAKYTAQLYAELESETGQATGYRQCGSVSIATNPERLIELKRNASMAKCFDLQVDMLTREEVAALNPMINTRDVLGGVHIPSDGYSSPIDTTRAMAIGARQKGALIREGVAVTRLLHDGTRITGVETSEGTICADKVVLCAGMWTRELAASAGVSVPLHACEHYYAVFDNVRDMPEDLPVLRDYDARAYFKPEAGKILVGGFEAKAKPWGMKGIPEDFCFDEIPGDFEHFEPLLTQAAQRLPALQDAGLQLFFCGPESFTPDVRYHLGEVPELDGCFVAAGLNSIGLQSAGGIGKVMAEWIRDGHPPMDLWEVDVRRNPVFMSDPDFLRERVSESLGMLYAMHWPNLQHETGRDMIQSPLHEKLSQAGACFGVSGGWERADWFARDGMAAQYEYSWGRQNWFQLAGAEHEAVRESVGLIDLSSMSKILLSGPDAQSALARICAADIAVEPGRVVYSLWLNERAGIEAEVSLMRLSNDEYLLCTPAASLRRDLFWLKRNIPKDLDPVVSDESHAWAVLAVTGPHARALMSCISDADFSNEAFAFASFQQLRIGGAEVIASRFSFTGELGWELFVTHDEANKVYESLVSAGEDFQIAHVGMQALNSLRLEKAYCHWGHDIGDEDDPVSAGLAWSVTSSEQYIGRARVQELLDRPPPRRLVQVLIKDERAVLWHNEPVLRDGVICGYVASGGWAYTLGGAVGLAYVDCPCDYDGAWFARGDYEVEIAGDRFPACVSLTSLYDPDNARLFR